MTSRSQSHPFLRTVCVLTIVVTGARRLASQTPAGPTTVSAASGTAPVAPESIVSIYGTNLATGVTEAPSGVLPLPTTLGNVSVTITDSTGVKDALPLFYTSPLQINAEIPAGIHTGLAQLTVATPSGNVTGSLMVAAVTPGLFSANETGRDAATAQVATNKADGSQTVSNVFQCSGGAGTCVPITIDLSAGPSALVLYGTGVRNRSSLSSVTVQIGSQTLPASYAGPAPNYVGLDQVNVLLPQSLAGAGIVNVSVSADGVVSNVLTVSFGFTSATPSCTGCTIWTNPPYTFPAQVQGTCNVSSITKLDASVLFPPASWPYTAQKVVSTAGVPTGTVDQLFIADVAANGSLQNQICLSCTNPAAPPTDRFKHAPSMRPQGDWILLDVENPDGPVIDQSSSEVLQVERNNGYWTNLWVTTSDGSRWYQLTHFTAPPGGNPGAVGILSPKWSPDGKMIVFAETYKAPDVANLQGYWHLYVANFGVDSTTGTPSLYNMTNIDFPGDVFYETQAFSQDSTQLVVQSYTPGVNAYGVDLYVVDLLPGPNFGHYTDITNSPYSWDEHAAYSPDGHKIAWISSLPFPNIIPQYGTLKWSQYRHYLHNEMFLMNSDGTDVQQLTRFNTPGAPEFTPQFGDAMYPMWNLDGTQLVIHNGTPEIQVPGGNSTWLVNFAGACGGQAKQ